MLPQSICRMPLVDAHEVLSRLPPLDVRDGWRALLTVVVSDAW
jgi:hypothetical protein